jgi:phenylpyruvate tautomerase PptA (4-oxalocrotonate tautomerase family)
MEKRELIQAQLGGEAQQGGGAMDREDLIDRCVEYLKESLYDEEEPKNWAKGILLWLDTCPEAGWGWSLRSIMGTFLRGLEEWNNLESEEREELARKILRRLVELAKKEEDWAGMTVEEWLELLKKELIKRGEIKDTEKWLENLWRNWLKYYINRLEPYEILDIVFEGYPDWDWMPKKEKRELAEEVLNLIKRKLKEAKQ